MSIHEIRSQELMSPYDNQNYVSPSQPQVKGGLLLVHSAMAGAMLTRAKSIFTSICSFGSDLHLPEA